MIADSAKNKGLRLTIDSTHASTMLFGDTTRLRQALLNYASNAVKFTESGTISIRAIVSDDSDNALLIKFEVKDNGTGVDALTQRNMINCSVLLNNSIAPRAENMGVRPRARYY